VSLCANGVKETGEDCDDGGTANGDDCSSTCLVEVATLIARFCPGLLGACPPCPLLIAANFGDSSLVPFVEIW